MPSQVLHNNRVKFPKDILLHCSVHQHGRHDVICKQSILMWHPPTQNNKAFVYHFMQVIVPVRVACRDTIGSLSTRVFGTRTATGSVLFSLLTCFHTTTFTFPSIFYPLEIISIKIWETPLPWREKFSLPVDVRVLKTRVLKLSNNTPVPCHSASCFPGQRPFTESSMRVATECSQPYSQRNYFRRFLRFFVPQDAII